MRIAALISAVTMLLLVVLGVACGPEDNYCVAEKVACEEEERRRNNMQPDNMDASMEDDGGIIVFDGSR